MSISYSEIFLKVLIKLNQNFYSKKRLSNILKLDESYICKLINNKQKISNRASFRHLKKIDKHLSIMKHKIFELEKTIKGENDE